MKKFHLLIKLTSSVRRILLERDSFRDGDNYRMEKQHFLLNLVRSNGGGCHPQDDQRFGLKDNRNTSSFNSKKVTVELAEFDCSSLGHGLARRND